MMVTQFLLSLFVPNPAEFIRNNIVPGVSQTPGYDAWLMTQYDDTAVS